MGSGSEGIRGAVIILVVRRLAPLLVLAWAAFAGEPSIDEEMFQSDIARMARLATAIPPGRATAAEFLKSLDPLDVEEDRELLPGARRLQAMILPSSGAGGYAAFYLTVLVHDGHIAELTCLVENSQLLRSLRVDEAPRGPTEARLLVAWAGKPTWTRVPIGMRLRWTDDARARRFALAVAKAFGAPEPTRAPGGSAGTTRSCARRSRGSSTAGSWAREATRRAAGSRSRGSSPRGGST